MSRNGMLEDKISPENLIRLVDRHLNNRKVLSRADSLRQYDLLTQRQKTIFWELERFMLMSRVQVADCSSRTANSESNNVNASRNLKILISAGLAERHKPKKGSHNLCWYLYSLSEAGVYVVEAARGKRHIKKTRSPFPPRLQEPQRIRHHLDLVSAGVSFTNRKRNDQYGRLMEWQQENTEYKFTWLGSRHVIRPDSEFLWFDGEQLNTIWLELHGENHTAAVREKIRKYIYYFTSRAFVRETLTYPPLCIVTRRNKPDTISRAVHKGILLAHITIAEAAPKIIVAVVHLDRLVAEGPHSAIWYLPVQGESEVKFEDILSWSLSGFERQGV